MTRLLDLGIEHIQNIVMDMAKLSERSVFASIESYEKGTSLIKKQIFDWSENLRLMQDEVSDLSMELIARYQPVATDLRFIRSCMEIAYDFSRFGRYSYDIADVLETMGSISDCDKSYVLKMSNTVREMIHLSINALQSRDRNAAQKLYEMDDTVDALYRRYVNEIINPQENQNKKEFLDKTLRCYISALLILRYLERISDHACYIGDSVYYIVTGNSNPRR
ncbi:MAG TPA: phosphate uptake regulator PhoU [Nitrososphaeraceae archaeon]|nr:phosphate uptake regulator PhoU [Nitrososphaeraceae archaeon]